MKVAVGKSVLLLVELVVVKLVVAGLGVVVWLVFAVVVAFELRVCVELCSFVVVVFVVVVLVVFAVC